MGNENKVDKVEAGTLERSRRGTLGAYPADISGSRISAKQLDASRRGKLGAFPDSE